MISPIESENHHVRGTMRLVAELGFNESRKDKMGVFKPRREYNKKVNRKERDIGLMESTK